MTASIEAHVAIDEVKACQGTTQWTAPGQTLILSSDTCAIGEPARRKLMRDYMVQVGQGYDEEEALLTRRVLAGVASSFSAAPWGSNGLKSPGNALPNEGPCRQH